jgi:hypothetical protein
MLTAENATSDRTNTATDTFANPFANALLFIETL